MMLQTVVDVLLRRGSEGWLVGGSVRDRELGRDSPDLDIVVGDDARAVAKEIAADIGAPWFLLSERHPAYRVMGRAGHIDVAAARGGGIRDDLGARDFTVNAMALPIHGGLAGSGPAGGRKVSRAPIESGLLIDPFGGLEHLRVKRLVAVSDHIFSDDPLRLMRAARFCHVLGFDLDASLAASIRAQARELVRTAPERVAAEMMLTLAEGRSADAVRLWWELGLLGVVLPETACAARLDACVALLERLDCILSQPLVWFPATAGQLVARFLQPVDGAATRPVALRLAGLLLHLSEAEMEAVGHRLKLSGDLTSLLRNVSRCFLQPPRWREGSEEGIPALPRGRRLTRAEVLFLWGAAPVEPEVVLLAAAAGADSVLPAPVGRMMALWAERTAAGVARPPVGGELLMSELGLQGGPLMGRALREVQLAWEMGEATTVSGLLAVARDALESTRLREDTR